MAKYKTQILNIKSNFKDYFLFVYVYTLTKRKARIQGVFSLHLWGRWATSGLHACIYGKHLSLMSHLANPKIFSNCQLVLYWILYRLGKFTKHYINFCCCGCSISRVICSFSLSAENEYIFTKDVFPFARKKNLSGQESNKMPNKGVKMYSPLFHTL